MLPSRNRLKKGVFFVIKRGKRISSPYFLVYSIVNNRDHSRFAVVVNKKIGSAVQRNKVKRRVRSYVYEIINTIPSGFDIIIMPSKYIENWEDISFDSIKKTLHDLINRI